MYSSDMKYELTKEAPEPSDHKKSQNLQVVAPNHVLRSFRIFLLISYI